MLFIPLVLILMLAFAFNKRGVKQQASNNIYLGAYYFDGWQPLYEKGPINDKLTNDFPERKPIWGWLTSTPEIMSNQIDAAANAGISFFSFDWYYPNSKRYTVDNMPLNHALSLYLQAPNNNRLKFNLMVVNQKYYEIGPDDWDALTQRWIELFKNPQYVRVNNKPLIIFFSAQGLINKFGSVANVHEALDKLRQACVDAGLGGVTIGAGVSPSAIPVKDATACGFDAFTGYSYRSGDTTRGTIPIEEIQRTNLWDRVEQNTTVPFMPVITLNWDPRSKAMFPKYAKSPVYVGYSGKTVYRSVLGAKEWMKNHPNQTTRERVAIMYAWNEYNEGAWLTPSDLWGTQLLDAVKAAVDK